MLEFRVALSVRFLELMAGVSGCGLREVARVVEFQFEGGGGGFDVAVNRGEEIFADLEVNEFHRVYDAAVGDLREVVFANSWRDGFESLEVGRVVDRNADSGGGGGRKGIDVGGFPIDVVDKAVVDDVGEAEANGAVVGEGAEAAGVNAVDKGSVGPEVVLALDAAVDDFGVHAGAGDVFADFVNDEDVDFRGGEFGHPGFDFTENFFLLGNHGCEALGGADSGKAGGFVKSTFLNGEAAEDFTAGEDASADAADHLFEANAVRVCVVSLGSGKFAEADGHHLEEAAFERAHEIGMPFDAGEEENAIGIEGGFVHEGFDAFGRFADGDDFEGTDDRDAHGGFVDAVVGEHVRLAFGSGCAVAAHRGNNEGLRALLFPEVDGGFGDAGNVGNAAAADTDGDACAFGDVHGDVGRRQFLADVIFDVGNGAVGERLFGVDEPGKVHVFSILRRRIGSLTLPGSDSLAVLGGISRGLSAFGFAVVPALFEHHGVLAGCVEIEHVVFGLGAFEDPVAEALLVPLIEVAVVAAQEFGGKVFGFGNSLKDGVQAYGAAEKSAKIQYTPAFEL